MNIHHPTAADQAKKARELKEKFFGKPAVTNRAVVTKAAEPAPDYSDQIARLEVLIQQAANICELLSLQIKQAHVEHPVGTLKEKIAALADPILERHGLTFKDVISRRTMPAYKAARREVWKAAYEGLPTHSINEIAHVLGRHYTTLSDVARQEGWDHSKRMQTCPRKAGEGSR